MSSKGEADLQWHTCQAHDLRKALVFTCLATEQSCHMTHVLPRRWLPDFLPLHFVCTQVNEIVSQVNKPEVGVPLLGTGALLAIAAVNYHITLQVRMQRLL